MRRRTPVLLVFYVLSFSLFFSSSQDEKDALIFPDPEEKICIVRAAGRDGDILMGEKLGKDNPLAKKILEQLEFPYHRSVIKLSQCARNLAADAEGPNVLFLSETEGGFPRQGLILDFHVWEKIKGRLNPESVILIEFIQEWGRSFPEDREEILKLFVMTTVGKTVTQELAKTYEAMSYHGLIGDYANYRRLAEKFRDEASTLIQNTLKGEAKLDANVGLQIWVENRDFLIRTALWNPENKKPLSVNLNTASEYDLASFPKIGLEKSRDLIKKRDELGYFTSLQQAKKLGFQFE